jgi:hypothetical protein
MTMLPSDWSRAKLGDLLPRLALIELQSIFKRDCVPNIKVYKTFCRKYRKHLEAKGVLPEYLAYVLYGKAIGAIP